MSAGVAPEGGNFPIPARLVLAKDVHIAVIGIDLETALRWREQAINHGVHSERAPPARTQGAPFRRDIRHSTLRESPCPNDTARRRPTHGSLYPHQPDGSGDS